jgi:transitional endoplasmic reticulum ATPase
MALREDMDAKTITLKHFQPAMKKVNPSVTKEIQKSYEEIGEHFRSARAEEMQKEKPSYYG